MATETVHFSIEGEFITDRARALWGEGAFAKAFDLLSCCIGMSMDQQVEILEGRKKLTGWNDLDFIDDDWSPPEGYPSFMTALERAGSFDAHELERRRHQEAEDCVREAEKIQNDEWTDGERAADAEFFINRARHLIGEDATEAMLIDLKNDRLKEMQEWSGRTWEAKRLENDIERLESRVDPVALAYAEAQSRMQLLAMSKGQDPCSVPSIDAMMKRGYDIKPELFADMASPSGWLLPNGKYYGCGNMEHIGLAHVLLEPEVGEGKNCEAIAEERGWIKISVGMLGCNVMAKRKPTKKQRDKVFDYSMRHKRDYNELMRQIDLCYNDD